MNKITSELVSKVDWGKLIAEGLARMTPEDWKRQRISFAYGNGILSNPDITRESVERAAAMLDLKETSSDSQNS